MSHQGKTTITFAAAGGFFLFLFIGWNGWLTDKIFAQEKENANQAVIDERLKRVETATGELPDMRKDIGDLRTDGAVTRTLLENLSKDRFQYDPRPSAKAAVNELLATTTQP